MEAMGSSLSDGGTGEAQDVLRRLEAYEDLSERYGRYASLLENAVAHRRSVREQIFEKVRREYEEKREGLERERDRLGGLLRENLETFVLERERIEQASREGNDRLEEIDFRVLVGEHPAESVAQERDELGRSLKRHAEEMERLEAILDAYARAGLSAASVRDGGPSDPDPAPDTGGPEGTRALDLPEASAAEAEAAGPARERSGPAGIQASAPGAGATVRSEGRSPASFQVLARGADPAEDGCPVVQCLGQTPKNGSRERNGFAGGPAVGSPVDASAACVSGYLVAIEGSRRGERFPLLCSNITLGTSPGSDIRLTDPGIRNFHAQIHFKGRKHYLENLDAMGCSFVNGLQGGLMELKDGDIIRLGEVKFQVEFSDVN